MMNFIIIYIFIGMVFYAWLVWPIRDREVISIKFEAILFVLNLFIWPIGMLHYYKLTKDDK